MKNTLTLNSLVASLFLLVASGSAYAIDDSNSALNMPIGTTLEFTRDIFMSPLETPEALWTYDVLAANGSRSKDQKCSIHTAAGLQVAGKTLSIVAGSTKSITRVIPNGQLNTVDFALNKQETILLRCGRYSPNPRNNEIHITIGDMKSLLKDAGILLNTEVKTAQDVIAI